MPQRVAEGYSSTDVAERVVRAGEELVAELATGQRRWTSSGRTGASPSSWRDATRPRAGPSTATASRRVTRPGSGDVAAGDIVRRRAPTGERASETRRPISALDTRLLGDATLLADDDPMQSIAGFRRTGYCSDGGVVGFAARCGPLGEGSRCGSRTSPGGRRARRGSGRAGELEVLVAADLVGERGDGDGLGQVGGGRGRRPAARRRRSYSGIIARSSLRTSAQRNGSATVPRRRLERASVASTRLGARPELHLLLHPGGPQHRRVQAPRHLGARSADGLVPGPGLGRQQQPGDLVLVLVRHQLVAVAGDGLGERGARRVDALLGPAGDADEVDGSASA